MSDLSLNTDPNSSSSFHNASETSHLGFVHYNIQSLLQKVDILYTGHRDFDIIGFTETSPIRKDRPDSHGGVAIYVNETISLNADMISNYIMLNVYGLKYFSQPISQFCLAFFIDHQVRTDYTRMPSKSL